MTRVVITGIGAVSPIGNTPEEIWQSARAGKSGIGWITLFDAEPIKIKIAGEVKNYSPEDHFDRRTVRRTDRAQQFALLATKQALEDSGLEVTDENTYDIGCVVGTGIGGIGSTIDNIYGYRDRGQRGVSPTRVPSILSDQISAQISMDFQLRGPNYAVINACSSGSNAIGEAADMIRLGRAKAVVAGGAEACNNEIVMSGFDNMTTLSHQYTDDPTKASRPFDLNRDGFVTSEGSGMVILEDLEHAKARGAKIYAEVTGYGHTSDAFHVTAPSPDGAGAARAIMLALKQAGLKPEDIGYINAHGTGTKLNDASETVAIKTALGEQAYNIPISSTKSMTGHMMGASSAVETIISVLAIRDNYVPPTINLETPDPECDLNYTPLTGKEHPITHVLNNAFGFGGHNIVLALSAFSE